MFIRSKESKQAKMDQKKNDQHVLPVPKINPNSIIDVLPAVGMEELDQPQQNLNFVQKFGNFLLRRPGPKHEHPYRPKIHPSSIIDVLPGVGMGQFNQPQPNLNFPPKFGNYLPRRPGPKGKDPHRHLYMSAPLPGPNSKALTPIPKASDRISVQPGPNPNLPKSNAAVPKVNPNVPKFEINVPNLHSKNRKSNSDLPGPRTRRVKKKSKSKINSSSEDLKTESWNTRDVIYLILLIFGVIMATAGTYKTFAMSELSKQETENTALKLDGLQKSNEEKLAKLTELQTELAKLAELQTELDKLQKTIEYGATKSTAELAKLTELQTEIGDEVRKSTEKLAALQTAIKDEVTKSTAIAENTIKESMTKLEEDTFKERTKLEKTIEESMTKLEKTINTIAKQVKTNAQVKEFQYLPTYQDVEKHQSEVNLNYAQQNYANLNNQQQNLYYETDNALNYTQYNNPYVNDNQYQNYRENAKENAKEFKAEPNEFALRPNEFVLNSQNNNKNYSDQQYANNLNFSLQDEQYDDGQYLAKYGQYAFVKYGGVQGYEYEYGQQNSYKYYIKKKLNQNQNQYTNLNYDSLQQIEEEAEVVSTKEFKTKTKKVYEDTFKEYFKEHLKFDEKEKEKENPYNKDDKDDDDKYEGDFY